MLPQSNIGTLAVIKEEQPNKTYKLDLVNNRIAGNITGLGAVKQSAEKILATERYDYLIYSWDYGIELKSLIGKEKDFVISEVKRRIEEALKVDDRIKQINNFTISISGDKLTCNFTVVSKEGSFEMEVSI